MFSISPVDEFPADAAFKETGASVAGEDAVVFPRARVPADNTGEPKGGFAPDRYST